MGLSSEYFDFQNTSELKYGHKTVVLMQVGSFYEAYSTADEGNACDVAKVCNMILTSKNKNESISFMNPHMCGMPLQSLQRYMSVLIGVGYTVVIVDQIDDTTPILRDITRVHSPGTFTDDTTDDTSVISCVYSERGSASLCWINTSTGHVHFEETFSAYQEEELYRMVESCDSKETLVCVKGTTTDKLSLRGIYHNIPYDVIYECTTYQNEVFSRVYKTESLITAIESIQMEMYHIARISLCILLSFCEDHHPSIVYRISQPLAVDTNRLILHNTSMHQLQLINPELGLFDIINKTHSAMGKRLLKDTMLHPFNDPLLLMKSYDDISNCIPKKEILSDKLKRVCDIDKIIRKISNNNITLCEVRSLINSLHQAAKIADLTTEFSCTSENYGEFINTIYIKLSSIIDMSESDVFMRGVYNDIDELKDRKQMLHEKLLNTCANFSRIIGNNTNDVKLEHTKDNYSIIISESKSKILKKRIGSQIHFTTDSKKRISITTESINTDIHSLVQCETDYTALENEKFNAFVHALYDSNIELRNISKFVAKIDLITSYSIVSTMYNYIKPTIRESDVSYVRATNVRHAIVERLDHDVMYTGNDIDFSNTRGMLLYGVNGSGKSCFAKSIGIAVILAQMGMFVPATTFEFCPYNRIFTRISSDDNIYKGQSSFFVEMLELNSILKCSNCRSLIIGDEVCKGTETISAISIVASICHLITKQQSSYIFATHLHGLPQLEPIKSIISKIQIKHIGVTIVGNHVSFDRKLQEGQGDDLYGLEIANHILNNSEFSRIAQSTRNAVLNKSNIPKRSRYNNKIIKTKCEICTSMSNLHAHHISFQSTAHDNIKNAKANLVVLCHDCHDKVHHGTLTINGWQNTSEGVILSFCDKTDNS